MSDITNSLSDNIKTNLKIGIRDGALKDGNIPIKTIIDNLKFENTSRGNLPLIQFGMLNSRSSKYFSNEKVMIVPFSIKFICWVDKGTKADQAVKRAKDVRALLMDYLDTKWMEFFGASFAIVKENVSIDFDIEGFSTPYAIGAGVTINGELFDTI